jgi:transposase
LEGHLLMSQKERKRRGAFEMVQRGSWSLVDAAERLEISYRQCRRSFKRYLLEDDAGLVHKGRGRPSNRRRGDGLRQAVIERCRETYEGFGPTLAAEKLEEEGYKVDHETLRRWLKTAGLWHKRRKRSPYRQRRERRRHFGELIQLDGSFHHWFGEGLPESCLIKLIDDATGIRLSLMAEEETTEACMRALWQWIRRYGMPKALYTDKKNVYVTDRKATLREQLAGEEPRTAFGMACAKLGIEIIAANSPQAKGRVERAHGVDQDRLVKELKLRGVTTIEGANELLAEGFTDKLNEKFAVPAKVEEDYHRRVPSELDLAHVFCFEENRVVTNDWVVRYHNRSFQISSQNESLPKPKSRVIVQRLLDGTVRLLYEEHALRYKEVETTAVKAPLKTASPPKPPTLRTGIKPAANHPWRNSKLCPGSTVIARTQQ